MRHAFAIVLSVACVALASEPAEAQSVSSMKKKKARLSCLEMSLVGSIERDQTIPQPFALHSSATPVTPGAVWTHHDAGRSWIGGAVSIGLHGTQVFAESDVNAQSTQLFSVFDVHPPTPVFTDGVSGSERRMLASAEVDDTRVSICQVPFAGDPDARQVVLRKFSGLAGAPDWTHTFEELIDSTSRVGISRDGATIVAALYDDQLGRVRVAVFGPGSSTPLATRPFQVGPGNHLRGFDLSADGSTVVLSAGTTLHVLDTATLEITFSTDTGADFASQAVSGDGSVLAYGGFNSARVLERSGGTYALTHELTPAGSLHCGRLDLSDDGSTLALGWNHHDSFQVVTIQALDVPTKAVTMTEVVIGAGGLQNVVSDLVCSADGERFAVGLWGDGLGHVDELRLYSRSSGAPLATLDTAGSVFDVDLSADGQRAVAASKAVHANAWGSGGRVDLLFLAN